jgi:RNA polymerase sigma-70 factor (ECF subfamily)
VSDFLLDPRRARFETLFTRHHDAVLTYLVRRSDSREDAADLVADTFLTAWRRLDDVPADEQTLPWLYGVARRVLANHRRGENRRHSLADKLRDDLSRSAPVGLSSPDPVLQQTAEAFRQLSDNDRELLSLAAWEGLDNAQLATALGCSSNAVGVRLYRARRRLERLIAGRDSSIDQLALPAKPRGEES